MKVHLLYPDRDFDFPADPPANAADLIADLVLEPLFQAMSLGDRFLFDVSQRVLLANLRDPEVIRYRQQVLADCAAAPDVVGQLYATAVGALEDKRGIWGYTSQYPSTTLSGAVRQLEAALVRLRQLREIVDAHADSFRSAGLTALCRVVQAELSDTYLATISAQLADLHFGWGVLLSAELDRDNTTRNVVLRAPRRARGSWRARLAANTGTSSSFTVPDRDDAGLRALAALTDRGLNLVANAAAQSADHVWSYFRTLRAELGFYIGCLNLRETLRGKDVPVAVPDVSAAGDGEFACVDLRDVSLVLRSQAAVIGNDVVSRARALVVVTGANSGGKSTFLRSVGLAQLMAQAGMFVVAHSFSAPVCTGIFTHFVRGEDTGMSSGRLDEELQRMSAIAEHVTTGSLVLFNESFATTNEREGSEIGRQVVRALLEAGVRVFFVTHQFDLAEGFRQQRADSTLFLRAPRLGAGQPDYRLVVGEPLPTSFAEDLYARIGGW